MLASGVQNALAARAQRIQLQRVSPSAASHDDDATVLPVTSVPEHHCVNVIAYGVLLTELLNALTQQSDESSTRGLAIMHAS